MKVPRGIDVLVSLVLAALFLWPELGKRRTWWWALMVGGREGARRCGQVALLAETHYRAEVEI